MGMYEPHHKEFTRRHFLAGSGVVAAAAAGGVAGYVIAQVDGRGTGAPESHAATPTPLGGLLPGRHASRCDAAASATVTLAAEVRDA